MCRLKTVLTTQVPSHFTFSDSPNTPWKLTPQECVTSLFHMEEIAINAENVFWMY